MRHGAFRRIAGVEIGDTRTLRRLGQELQKDAAGAPAMIGAALARAQFLGHRQPHPRRDLLGAVKIFMRRVFQRPALERDQALITAHVRALIDGHGEMAFAEQRAGVGLAVANRRGNAIFVEARAGAHLAGAVKSTTSMRTGPSVCVCRMKRPSIFKAEPSMTVSTTASPKQLGHRLRIGMSVENPVDHRPEPHHAAAQVERGHFERHDGVVGRGGRRRA